MTDQQLTPDAPPLLGGRYRLDHQLAQGGMAEVWVATDTLLSRTVAIKLLKPHLAQDPIVAERFRREAIAVAGLSHPNIVAVHDTVDDGGRQAVVMQYVAGKSLRQLLDEQRKLGPDLTSHIGIAVASALDAAHRAGLVHRDVKPGNILLTPDGRVLLADFGIAKAIGSDDGHDLTSDNVMMGTAKYLAPEQVRGRRLDGRADLYALGLVLYECLAGRVPFLGESDADTALARLQRDPTDLGRLRPTLPRGLVGLIHQLLEREPEDRPASGAAVRATLTRVLNGVDDHTTPVARPGPSRSGGGRDATPSIPGEPLAAQEVNGAPSRSAVGSRSLTATPDRTPPAPRVPRSEPARSMQQRWTPSLVVVAVLLVAAVVTAVVLWAALDGGDAADAPAADAPADTDDAGADDSVVDGGDDTVIVDPVAGGPAGVVGLRSYDPNGDGEENDQLLANLTDGNPNTTWTTLCYEDRYLGAKQGVGVVVELDRPSAATAVEVDVASAPWQLRLYAAEELPDQLGGWGEYVASDFGSEARTANLQADRPARYLLVWMNELARQPSCSSANPFQGALSRVEVRPTG
jgi:eukaryotic-like serine/threonine-protein kinase